jgi:hypothetical protein
MKWQDIKQSKYQEHDFGPQTPEEEVIFAEEAARVDREVAEYQGTWRCHYDQARNRLRFWYHRQLDRDGLVYNVERWCYFRVRSVRFLYQRLTRGWDDSVTWSLDIHLAGLILPRLKRFKELNTHAYPNGLTPESWAEIIDKMIYAFEFTMNEDKMFGKFNEAEYDRAKEGLQLFGQYFHALWD